MSVQAAKVLVVLVALGFGLISPFISLAIIAVYILVVSVSLTAVKVEGTDESVNILSTKTVAYKAGEHTAVALSKTAQAAITAYDAVKAQNAEADIVMQALNIEASKGYNETKARLKSEEDAFELERKAKLDKHAKRQEALKRKYGVK